MNFCWTWEPDEPWPSEYTDYTDNSEIKVTINGLEPELWLLLQQILSRLDEISKKLGDNKYK